MRIGGFALVEPFAPMQRQFQAIAEMGFDLADITDNQIGATLGNEFGFGASISLSSHPDRIAELLGDTGIQLAAVCAHANLLDPPGPDVYSTNQIIHAIKLAHFLDIDQVITTEGDPKTVFGDNLSQGQRLFAISERLYWPIRWANRLGIELLIEPHGIVSDNVDSLAQLLDMLGHEQTVGINLDTGNAWLGGADPLDYVKTFGQRIRHVHWKDMSAKWEAKRGKIFGCGMATIPLGDGVIDIPALVKALKSTGFDGPTTLEIAGAQAVVTSAQRLREWWREASEA